MHNEEILCENCGENEYDRIYHKKKLCDMCIIELEYAEEDEKRGGRFDDEWE